MILDSENKVQETRVKTELGETWTDGMEMAAFG